MNLEAFQINGKNALVTGSHRGLGAAIAVALAKAGANVGCHGRDPNPGAACDEILAAGRKTFYFSADLADSKLCSALIEETISKFGSTTPLHCETILCVAAKYSIGFPRRVGASRVISQAQRYSSAHPPATMCTDMSLQWTAAGWDAKEASFLPIRQNDT